MALKNTAMDMTARGRLPSKRLSRGDAPDRNGGEISDTAMAWTGVERGKAKREDRHTRQYHSGRLARHVGATVRFGSSAFVEGDGRLARELEPTAGIEPATSSLPRKCSTD